MMPQVHIFVWCACELGIHWTSIKMKIKTQTVWLTRKLIAMINSLSLFYHAHSLTRLPWLPQNYDACDVYVIELISNIVCLEASVDLHDDVDRLLVRKESRARKSRTFFLLVTSLPIIQ